MQLIARVTPHQSPQPGGTFLAIFYSWLQIIARACCIDTEVASYRRIWMKTEISLDTIRLAAGERVT